MISYNREVHFICMTIEGSMIVLAAPSNRISRSKSTSHIPKQVYMYRYIQYTVVYNCMHVHIHTYVCI